MSGQQSEQEVYQALQLLREEPYGVARSARTEELVETADRLAFDEVYAVGLFELMQAYEYGGETIKTPVLFARILKLYDTRPQVFNEWRVHRMYWYYKWITGALLAVPDVPLATIEAFVEQMRERYLAAGHKLQAVYRCRFVIAQHTGVGADDAYEDWATRARDEFSDCEACEARNRGQYWAQRGEGDDVRALREWGPVLDGRLGCQEEPAATISHALSSLVRVGRLAEAASLHRSGYRATRGQPSMDGEVGRHIEFAARTGNAPRGLELLAENRGRFDSGADPLSRLAFLSGVRVLLAGLAAAGHGAVPTPVVVGTGLGTGSGSGLGSMPGAGPVGGANGAPHTVDSLLAVVAEQTDALAARFDARNGTSTFTDGLRERLAQPALTAEQLPLGLGNAFRAVLAAPAGGADATAEAAAAAGPAGSATTATAGTATTGDPAHRPGAEAGPAGFAALLSRAREVTLLGQPDADQWEAVARRVTEADFDDLLRAELAVREVMKLSEAGSFTEAREAALRSRDLFLAAGEPGRGVVAAARAAWCLAAADSTRLDTRGERAGEAGQGRQAGQSGQTGQGELPGQNNPGAQGEHTGQAGLSEQAGQDHQAGQVGQGEAAAPAEATIWAELDEALAQAEDLLARDAVTARQFTSVLYTRAAAAGMALGKARVAARDDSATADRADESGPADRTSLSVARARFDQENLALRERALQYDVPDRVASALSMSAQVLVDEGNLAGAEPLLQEALALLDQAEQVWHTPRPLLLLAGVLQAARRPDEAAKLLDQAQTALALWPDRSVSQGRLLAMQAENLRLTGDLAAAAGLFAAAADRFDLDAEPSAAAHCRTDLGQVLLRADRAEDAIAVLESLFADQAEAGLDRAVRAQARLDLGNALLAREEYRAAAETFVWLADFTADWPQPHVQTLACAKLAAALFSAGMWAQADQAAERTLESHATGPNPAEVCRMLRIGADASYQGRGAQGTEAALALLRQADEVNEAATEQGESGNHYHRWPERAQNALLRATVLASAEPARNEEALAAAESSAIAWREGATATIDQEAEAVRIAAIVEGARLGRKQAATDRLTQMIARCRDANRQQAAGVLEKLKASLAE